MSSKRARKAQKRAQREARRERRRAHSAGGDDHQQAHARQQPASPIITAPAELASYMVSPREAHGQTRRARHATQETTRTTDLPPAEKIGYMAYDGHDFLRKHGECIVAASAAQMQRTATHVFPDTRVVIRGLTFEEIYVLMEGMREAFCFDQESYDRFVEEAQNRRMAVGDLQNKDLHLLFPEWEWAVEP